MRGHLVSGTARNRVEGLAVAWQVLKLKMLMMNEVCSLVTATDIGFQRKNVLAVSYF